MRRSYSCYGRPFALLTMLLFVTACRPDMAAAKSSEGIRIAGPRTPPHLEFACCDHGLEQMQSLFAQLGVIGTLKDLHASVAIPTLDFSPQRAGIVRLLNQQGVPTVGWIILSEEDGYYLTADNVPQAIARVADFEQWTSDNGLRWAAVGLDIEPNFTNLKNRPWHLVTTLLGRSINRGRIERAHAAYSTLVGELRSRGYPVQIYLMPYVPAERSVHSSLPDRLLGTVDLSGDQDFLMLYTSYARPVGAGMIWSLGPHARGIGIGSTDGDTAAGQGNGPLDWNEFSRDLIVASHFTNQIGIYNLEGCVHQGFLPRLLTMDWSQSVVIPAESVRRAERFGFIARAVLWIASNLIYLITAGVLLIALLLWRWHTQRKEAANR